MNAPEESRQPLTQWLLDRGHSDAEIAHILASLQRYDELTTADALMDAIARGEVDLDAIVQEFKEHE